MTAIELKQSKELAEFRKQLDKLISSKVEGLVRDINTHPHFVVFDNHAYHEVYGSLYRKYLVVENQQNFISFERQKFLDEKEERYLDYIVNNIEWIFSGLGVSALIGFVALIQSFRAKRCKRISDAVLEYKKIYGRNGSRLKCLIPSGIHTLKSNAEFKTYFKDIMEIEPHHPLRNWKNDIENIGYKKFFLHVFRSGKHLDKENIDTFIKELQLILARH